MTDTDRQQAMQTRVQEFLRLLPMTLELAGLPKSEHGRYYNEEQIAARAITLKYAYKVARQTLLELVNQG